MHERAGLLAVSPHFDFISAFGQGDLAADSCWRFLFSAFVGAQWTVHVMKADDRRLESVVFVVVTAEFLSKKFFPAVARFGVGGVGILLPQRLHIGIFLLEIGRASCRER